MARKKKKKPARQRTAAKKASMLRPVVDQPETYFGGLTAIALGAIPRLTGNTADDPFSSHDPLGNWLDLSFT